MRANEARTVFAEMHVPTEVQYEISKGIYLNGELSANARLEFFRSSLEEFVQLNPKLSLGIVMRT